jgi:tRNA pseudouridine55 synthase
MYHGFINVNKEKNMTSHDVVSRIRKILNMKKVGHTGTLDPNAQGVLPICLGHATKLSSFLTEKDKKYCCEIIFGKETDSCDLEGTTLFEEKSMVSKDDFEKILFSMVGDSRQQPPIYSAIKVNGKKLYEYARKGIEVEIPYRNVRVIDVEIIDVSQLPKKALFNVTGSKGIYIRSLCRDIGKKLNTYACMGELTRLQSGKFVIDDSYTLQEIEKFKNSGEINSIIKPLSYPLEMKSYIVKNEALHYLLNGNVLFPHNLLSKTIDGLNDERIQLLNEANELKGIGKIVEDDKMKIQPIKVFI